MKLKICLLFNCCCLIVIVATVLRKIAYRRCERLVVLDDGRQTSRPSSRLWNDLTFRGASSILHCSVFLADEPQGFREEASRTAKLSRCVHYGPPPPLNLSEGTLERGCLAIAYSLTQSTGPVSVPRCCTRFDRERASLSRRMPSLVGCDACNSVLHRAVNKGRLRNQRGCGFFLEMIRSRPPRVHAPPSTRPFSQTSFTTAYMYVYI